MKHLMTSAKGIYNIIDESYLSYRAEEQSDMFWRCDFKDVAVIFSKYSPYAAIKIKYPNSVEELRRTLSNINLQENPLFLCLVFSIIPDTETNMVDISSFRHYLLEKYDSDCLTFGHFDRTAKRSTMSVVFFNEYNEQNKITRRFWNRYNRVVKQSHNDYASYIKSRFTFNDTTMNDEQKNKSLPNAAKEGLLDSISERLSSHVEALSRYGSMNGSNCHELRDYIFASFLDIEYCHKKKIEMPMGPLLHLVYHLGNLGISIIGYFPEKEEAVKHMFKTIDNIVRDNERMSSTYSMEADRMRRELHLRTSKRSKRYNIVFTEEDGEKCLALADNGETSCRMIIEGLEEFAREALAEYDRASAKMAAALAVELLERPNTEIRQAKARKELMQDLVNYATI